MRLDDFDNDIEVEDQRGSGGGGGFPMGGLIGGNGGRIGCGTIVIALIGWAVFGINPLSLISATQGGQQEQVQPGPAQAGGSNARESCLVNDYSHESCNALSSLNRTWKPLFQQANIPFTAPKLVFYSRSGRSGCGTAQSAMGPFYCPNDQGIYIDTEFYDEMQRKLGANGAFSRDYVIAHEYGHHIQNLLGLSEKAQEAEQANPSQANPISVRVELQADCYAGVWAARNKDRIEAGDIESGLNAAHQIGDDTLMAEAGQRPVEAAFTHGSSAERMAWLKKGLDTGDDNQCDTFARGAVSEGG